MIRTHLCRCAMVLALGLSTQFASAVSFDYIRIGDVDSFGYTGNLNALYQSASGGPVDAVGADNRLRGGDFLPDLNRDGVVATGNGDDFDHRDAAEIAGAKVQGNGFIPGAQISGSQYTDIALSTSFDNTFPGSPDFPGDGNPNTLSNQPGFVFDFSVNKADIDSNASLFFNLIFADYDVSPASVRFRRLNGTTFSRSVNTQSADGLVQELSIPALPFNDIFTDNGATWRGYLEVDFLAPSEPYTAFDLVEISTNGQIVEQAIPLPMAAWAALPLLGMIAGRRSSRKRLA